VELVYIAFLGFLQRLSAPNFTANDVEAVNEIKSEADSEEEGHVEEDEQEQREEEDKELNALPADVQQRMLLQKYIIHRGCMKNVAV